MTSTYRKYFTTAALIWSGCFVLFFLIHMLVLVPQKSSGKQIKKQLAEKKQMYNAALKTAQEETKFKLNEQIEHLRNELKNFVIDFEDSANLTLDISQIANNREITSLRIRTKDSRGGSAIPNCNYLCENHIDISFTTGFNQFAAFLNALERHQPIIFVDNFTITRSDQDHLGHKVSMDLAVFVRKRHNG